MMDSLLESVAQGISALGVPVTPRAAGWLLEGLAAYVVLGVVGVTLRERVNLKVWFGGLALIAPLLVVLALAFQYDPHEIDSPLVGKTAPDFVLTPIDGGAPVRLSDQRGKPVVVNFWATWCVPCQAEHRTLLAVAKKMEGKANFYGVVYQDTPEKIQAWLGEHGTGYPQLLDVGSKAAIAYGVYGVPETYVIDGSGKITWKFTGPIEGASLLKELAPLVTQ